MTNGDWLVYFNRSWKQPPHVRDLFVCRSSGGDWFESAYHFCSHPVRLWGEEQPADLPSFISRYKLTRLPVDQVPPGR
jgi:hypothetical protein